MRTIATAALIGLVSMTGTGVAEADRGRASLAVTPTDAQLARRSPLVREAARIIDRDDDAADRGLALWSAYIGLVRDGDAAVIRWALALQSVVRGRKGNYLHACWWVLREHSPRRARIFAAGLARRGVAIGPDSGHYENLAYLERAPPPPPLPERVGRTPIGQYVDNFAAVVYDLSYRPERKGQASKWLQVTYDDGTELDIDIRLISDNIDRAQNQSLGRMHLGAGGRLYPLRMDRQTTPHLWNAKHAALAAMRRSNEEFALIVTMAQVSTMTALPIGLVQPVQVPTAPAVSARAVGPSGGSVGAATPSASAAQPRAPPRTSAPAKTGPRPTSGRKGGSRLAARGFKPPPGVRTRPRGVPNQWRIRGTKGEGGVRWVDPKNPHNSVRVMPGSPNSPYANSRAPYVRWIRNGRSLDGNGNVVPRNSPESHIPLSDFVYTP